jgi:hypothetical protein
MVVLYMHFTGFSEVLVAVYAPLAFMLFAARGKRPDA